LHRHGLNDATLEEALTMPKIVIFGSGMDGFDAVVRPAELSNDPLG